MNEMKDPFACGIQTAEDRRLKVNTLNEAEVRAVLARDDIQASVRKHAEDRLRRLLWTEKHIVQRGKERPMNMTPSAFWTLLYLSALWAAETDRPTLYHSRIDGCLLGG